MMLYVEPFVQRPDISLSLICRQFQPRMRRIIIDFEEILGIPEPRKPTEPIKNSSVHLGDENAAVIIASSALPTEPLAPEATEPLPKTAAAVDSSNAVSATTGNVSSAAMSLIAAPINDDAASVNTAANPDGCFIM